MPKHQSIKKDNVVKNTDVDASLNDIMSQVKQLGIVEKKKALPKKPVVKPIAEEQVISELIHEEEPITQECPTPFPDDIEKLSDYGDNDDTEEILAKFVHNPLKEYNDVLFFHKISKQCVKFATEKITLKLDEKQRKLINLLINKIYEKIIIYTNNIVLNNLHPMYVDTDESIKEQIFKIRRLVEKLHDSSYILKKKFVFKKSEIVTFFNNVELLNKMIIDIVNDCIKE